MMFIIFIIIGGSIGAILRYFFGQIFSFGTVISNIIASILLGVFTQIPMNHLLFNIFTVGFCGGLSTFSTFIYELITTKKMKDQINYMLWNVVASIFAVAIGMFIGSFFAK